MLNKTGNNNNKPLFYPYILKCKGSCNTINDPYAKICVPDNAKNTNVKVFNLVSRIYEKRHIEWHNTCKCKCRLNVSVCINKQRWNEEKSRCECKELIDKEMCDKGCIWNPSTCECQCDKSCDVGEHLDYIDGNEMLYYETLDVIPLNVYKKVCSSCMVYIVLFAVFLIISICTYCVFIYFYWNFIKDNITTNFNVGCLNI